MYCLNEFVIILPFIWHYLGIKIYIKYICVIKTCEWCWDKSDIIASNDEFLQLHQVEERNNNGVRKNKSWLPHADITFFFTFTW